MENNNFIDRVIKEEFSKDLYTLLIEDLENDRNHTEVWYKKIAESSRFFHQGHETSKKIEGEVFQNLLFTKYYSFYFQWQQKLKKIKNKELLNHYEEQINLSYDFFKYIFKTNHSILKLYVNDSIMRTFEMPAWVHFLRSLRIANSNCREYLNQNIMLCKESSNRYKIDDQIILEYPYEENKQLLQKCYLLIRNN